MDSVVIDRRVQAYFNGLSEDLKERLTKQYENDPTTSVVLQKCALEDAPAECAWAEVALYLGNQNKYFLNEITEITMNASYGGLILTPESGARVLDLLEKPRPATEALKELFKNK